MPKSTWSCNSDTEASPGTIVLCRGPRLGVSIWRSHRYALLWLTSIFWLQYCWNSVCPSRYVLIPSFSSTYFLSRFFIRKHHFFSFVRSSISFIHSFLFYSQSHSRFVSLVLCLSVISFPLFLRMKAWSSNTNLFLVAIVFACSICKIESYTVHVSFWPIIPEHGTSRFIDTTRRTHGRGTSVFSVVCRRLRQPRRRTRRRMSSCSTWGSRPYDINTTDVFSILWLYTHRSVNSFTDKLNTQIPHGFREYPRIASVEYLGTNYRISWTSRMRQDCWLTSDMRSQSIDDWIVCRVCIQKKSRLSCQRTTITFSLTRKSRRAKQNGDEEVWVVVVRVGGRGRRQSDTTTITSNVRWCVWGVVIGLCPEEVLGCSIGGGRKNRCPSPKKVYCSELLRLRSVIRKETITSGKREDEE